MTASNFFLKIKQTNVDHLAKIRLWKNLNISWEENFIWVKNFSIHQINAIEVKQIPEKELYEQHGAKLHRLGSLLPSRTTPSLLWTPIQRGLPVEMPDLNHNFFGIDQKIALSLIATETTQAVQAILLDLSDMKQYIETAAAIRLKPLKWLLLENQKALVLGQPLLPIRGKSYWRRGDFFIPAGMDFELPNLVPIVQQYINLNHQNYLFWTADGSYFQTPKNAFTALSIASFRLSKKQ